MIMAGALFVSCELNPKPAGTSTKVRFGDYNIKTIDGCEYVEYDEGFGDSHVYSITHKGNCKFCAQRTPKDSI